MTEHGDSGNNADRRFRKLIENIDDTVTVVDAAGQQLWTSAAQNGDLGYEGDFWNSADLFSLVHDEDLPLLLTKYQSVLDEPEETVSGEVRLATPEGGYSHVAYVAQNLIDDPEIGGIIITSRSVEHEIDARLERDRRQYELEEALADRSKFIARLSHEMRSPLHAIQGLAEVLLASPHVDAADRRHIESIERESGALRHMLDDLLDLSKIGAGHMELQIAAFSPASVCDGIASTHIQQAKSKGLDLRIEVDSHVPRVVLGDEHRVRQILVNLISNAIKYTNEGSIILRLECVEGATLRFEVTDTGRGIPADQLNNLFEPYQQMRGEDTIVGTGIGLTITKNLTELMDGTIEVDSSPSGSTFTCEIPFQEGRRAADRAPIEEPEVKNMDAVEILVVDDSEVNRTLATAQLDRLGFQCTAVSSGFEAIDLVQQGAFDVILMDWHMPQLDGLETTGKIRGLGTTISQPCIIAMTASVMSGDRERCIAAGMDDYLAKPVSIADLDKMLGRWTSGSAASTEPSDGSTTIDPTALEKLVSDLGSAEIAHSVVVSFLTEMKKWRHDIVEGVQSDDLVMARRTAHTVKSSAALLGAASLSEACAAFEAEATTPSNADSLLKSVLESADRAEHDLRAQVAAWQ